MKIIDKRQRIMQTAEKLFANRRIHEITLDEVAQLAQIGKGTIYRYFEDKDDLFFQVATSGFDELCDLLEEKVPRDLSFQEQILAMCLEISAYFRSRREMFTMMLAEDARMPGCKGKLKERWLKQRKKLVKSVARILEHGVADGLVRHDVPSEILASFLLGLLRARALEMLDVPPEQRPHELVVDLFCNGVACPVVQEIMTPLRG
jgi:TetR/AcrR family fatty acid metabolism transcriptional regulator